MSFEEKMNDLPLVSNVNDISVQHYVFDFSCDFKNKCLMCHAVLFLEPVVYDGIDFKKYNNQQCESCICDSSRTCETTSSVENGSTKTNELSCKSPFVLILDCHKILIDEVTQIDLPCDECKNLKYIGYNPTSFRVGCKLNFSFDEWALKVWTEDTTCKHCFPRIIKVSYKTVPVGPSLLWVKDQEQMPAVFTYGAWVNNRSLFPCQEPPSAMATWEATVRVNNSSVVLMSGDEEPVINKIEGQTSYYYYTKNPLPMSTLCLAIGFWEEHVITSTCRSGPKCRIFAPPSLLDKAVLEFFEYIPYCLKVSEDLLGPYPFGRIDFLIVPPTFGSLGMASPHIVFLSQTLLAGDGSMCSRVAHEIGHGWFGLSIGASDWTEEWLSEGFATFMEDLLHVRTVHMTPKDAADYIEIKAFIRKKTLVQEIDNTDEELQTLRPSLGNTFIKNVDGIEAPVLKNGQNPVKAFVQVHYIKGYFLLNYLSNMVGVENFITFLKNYAQKFKGCLVTSKEFLTLFLDSFPGLGESLSLDKIYDDWLNNPGIVPELRNMKPAKDNRMYIDVLKETQKWTNMNKMLLSNKGKRRRFSLEHFLHLSAEQEILLLENLLDEESISVRLLEHLNEFFCFEKSNAEVQHRWFELIVCMKHQNSYCALETFLANHLAMGVYLFGELLFSGDFKQQKIAENCFKALESEMEPNYVVTIQKMLNDSQL